MKILPYKEIQKLADGKSEIEATRSHIEIFTFDGYTWRIPRFLELRMRNPDNPFIIIRDTTDGIEYAGPMSDAKEKRWFESYQSAFDPEAEWWVID